MRSIKSCKFKGLPRVLAGREEVFQWGGRSQNSLEAPGEGARAGDRSSGDSWVLSPCLRIDTPAPRAAAAPGGTPHSLRSGGSPCRCSHERPSVMPSLTPATCKACCAPRATSTTSPMLGPLSRAGCHPLFLDSSLHSVHPPAPSANRSALALAAAPSVLSWALCMPLSVSESNTSLGLRDCHTLKYIVT